MPDAKHTPGPWTIETHPMQDGAAEYHVIVGDGMALGRVYGPALPNARLIAAAPDTAAERDRLRIIVADLLAAAESALLMLFAQELDEAAEERKGQATRVCDALRAAIARALGKE